MDFDELVAEFLKLKAEVLELKKRVDAGINPDEVKAQQQVHSVTVEEWK